MFGAALDEKLCWELT